MALSMDAGGELSARVVVRVVDFIEARGHDPETFCQSVGVSLRTLRDPNARIPLSLAEKLGMRAVEVARDDNLGLHLAEDVGDPRVYDAGVLLMMSSATLRVGLERMERYQRYWGEGDRCQLVPTVEGISLRYSLPGCTGVYQRHADECALAEVVIGARALTGADIVPRAVRFRHPAPSDVSEHRALFRGPVTFGAPCTELEIDDAALDTPLLHANEAYRAIFQEQVERAVARLDGQMRTESHVRAVVQAALFSGDCSVESTARALGMSVRTLQRRLRVEGTSFAELIDALRQELAMEYLDNQMPVAQVAHLLGYGDASAFHRAFKRWTGTTPEQARAARAGPRWGA